MWTLPLLSTLMRIDSKTIDELTSRELLAIIKARIDIFVVEQNCVYGDIDGNDLIAQHVCLYQDNQLAAYARVFEHDSIVRIGRVLSTVRGKGYARALMQYCLTAHCESREVKISAQTYLIDFYASLGFVEVGETYLEDGLPHIEMRLSAP